MKNRFITACLCMLTVFAFSGLVSAQPQPDTLAPDVLTLNCGTAVYPGAPTVVQFDMVLTTDVPAGDHIVAMGTTLWITGTPIAGIGDSACAFTGSALVTAGFDILSVAINSNPSPDSYQVTYGGVDFQAGVGAGSHLVYHVCVLVDDTGLICIDSSSTLTTPWSGSWVTQDAGAYAAQWTTTCCPVVPFISTSPVVECGPNRETFTGGTFNHEVVATDPDVSAGICDDIVSNEFQFLDSTFAPIGGPNTAPCGVATLDPVGPPSPAVSSTFDWNTSGCPGGTYYVVFTFTDECGATGADTCCYVIKTACAFVKIGEVTADPCQTVEVPVTLTAFEDIGGFNFCIEFKNTDLTAVSVRRGDCIDDVDQSGKFVWHYFTYRLNPSTVIHKYKVCVIGIGRLYSAYPGMCIPGNGQPCVLFYIKFVLACNELFRCYDTHVVFEWDDWTCLENTLSSCDGNTLFVSDNDTLYNVDSCGLGEKNEIVPCVNFGNGLVIFRCPHDVDPIVIGDVNVNGFPYEIGDAVLFASYFVDGINVFSSDYDTRQAQIGATDINRDGYTLSVADLVYLVRILTGDQAPLGEGTALSADANASAYIDGNKVVIQTSEKLGAAVFTFKGETQITSLVNNLTVSSNAANGETKVIVYGIAKNAAIENNISLFAVNNGKAELVSVEAATYNAQPITVDVAGAIPLPNAYSLKQNYPNPFNATTQISFALPLDGNVSLKIYNVAGQMVKTYDQFMTAGYKNITWDGTNSRGEVVASGVYFYKLDTQDFTKTMKMTLLK